MAQQGARPGGRGGGQNYLLGRFSATSRVGKGFECRIADSWDNFGHITGDVGFRARGVHSLFVLVLSRIPEGSRRQKSLYRRCRV